MTTDIKLTSEGINITCSTLWPVEIFRESNQQPKLGKCRGYDFDIQITSTSTCMIQHNILSDVRRFNNYERLGKLFREYQKDTLKLTDAEQIWLIITETTSGLFEVFDIGTELLL